MMLTTLQCLQSEFQSACISPFIASLTPHAMSSTYIVTAYLHYLYTYVCVLVPSFYYLIVTGDSSTTHSDLLSLIPLCFISCSDPSSLPL